MENQKESIGSLILRVYLNAFIVDPDSLYFVECNWHRFLLFFVRILDNNQLGELPSDIFSNNARLVNL